MRSDPTRRRDILLIVFSALGILSLLIRVVYRLVTTLLPFGAAATTDLASSLLGAFGLLFCAALLLPMLVLSIRHLQGRMIPPLTLRPVRFWQLAVLVFTSLLVILAAGLINGLGRYGWLAALPFFLLGIGLPILGLLWIAVGGLPTGVRRVWSAYGIGMVGGTLTALVLEYAVVGVGVVLIGIAALASPDLLTMLNQIKAQVLNAGGTDIQTMLTVLAPYLTNPLVIFAILLFASVFTPLIEEAAKPIALWFLGKRLHSPAEGFLLGALCGAGFSTMEGILAASGASQMLGFGLAGRAAASLMHITASGIMGWGIASLILKQRPWRVALAYLVSVSLHGLWNGAAIMAVYGSLRTMTQTAQFDLLGGAIVLVSLGTLLLVLVAALIALPLINRRLRRFLPASDVQPADPTLLPQSDIIAPPAIQP